MFLLLRYFLFAIPLFAQSVTIEKVIGDFSSAQSFSLTPTNYFYVTDIETNEILKVGINGAIVQSTGGYGWNKESFDYPIDIFATTLNVYVTDHNNNRIQIFDRDLNFISIFASGALADDQSKFSYPTACAVSNQGDFLILDGDNSRILKYDISGNFVDEIGNLDAGIFALNNPTNFAISNDGKIFVLDESLIKVFDLFGNPIAKIESNDDLKSISIYNNFLCGNTDNQILIWNLSEPQKGSIKILPQDFNDVIKETIFDGKKLYLLSDKHITIFNVVN